MESVNQHTRIDLSGEGLSEVAEGDCLLNLREANYANDTWETHSSISISLSL